MRSHIPRETPAANASSLPQQCTPITPSVKLCPADIIAIAAVAVFICYIVWGVPPTIRAIRALHAKYLLRRRRRGIQVFLNGDLEEGMQDPYLGPTKHLRSFLLLSGHIALPERAYTAETANTPDTELERERLDSFRFPPGTALPSPPPSCPAEMSQSPSASSVFGLYSPPSNASLDREEPLSPYSSSFPAPPGLAAPMTAFGSPELCDGDRLSPLPAIPSPACLPDAPRGGSKLKLACKPCSW